MRFTARPDGAELSTIAKYVADGRVTVMIDQTFELREAAKALAYLANQHVHGKAVLRVRQRGSEQNHGLSDMNGPHGLKARRAGF